ncbi:MAG TPA: lipid-binding SYLF domain-containing protein [Pyrinomonadaceae bacterium]|nr:lipid-binding SYLF domain-containing protein [Pyrinomonadaceae bacterium]
MRAFSRPVYFSLFAISLLLLALAVPASAQKKSRIDDATRHAREAAETFTEIMNVRDKAIPKELLDKAEAIAVFPGVVKAAFIFGGRGGQGLISKRVRGGWSAPAFFNLSGGSFGAQIGAQKNDYVFLIMNEKGIKGLLEDKFEMGGEVGLVAGPVGREAAASTNATLDAGILSYSRSKGAFIGAALKGVVISPDNDLNQAIYSMKGSELLMRNRMSLTEMPVGVRIFPRTLARYSVR